MGTAQSQAPEKGSSWIPSKVTHKLKHRKQTKTRTSEIDVKLAPGLAKAKGLTIWGQALPPRK